MKIVKLGLHLGTCIRNLTTFVCWLSWNLGASTSWNPRGLYRDCFFIFTCIRPCVIACISTCVSASHSSCI